jgi:superfamily I DNA and RNA helicase
VPVTPRHSTDARGVEVKGINVLINTTRERLREDPLASQFVDLLEKNEIAFSLESAGIYHKFPLYKDNSDVVAAGIVVVSPVYGVLVVETTAASDVSGLNKADAGLDVVFGQLHARLTKNRSLRRDKRTLAFNLEPVIYAPNLPSDSERDDDVTVVSNRADLGDLLGRVKAGDALDPLVVREICSVIEGAKGLIVPRPRDTSSLTISSRASQINQLEAEIASFDQEQKHGYMEVFDGPQRIRGLAGSGKTVVLAMKAALTHLRDPDATIVYTFYTRSLYQHVRRLITRFYRQYDDRDPDWEKLHVMHAWGGRGRAGVYYSACLANGVAPLTYGDVSSAANPFDAVCSDLLKQAKKLRPAYDYVFVDEGQDYPASFLKICLSLARTQRFVYAYDELQNIFQAEIPSVETVFGAGFHLKEDIVLKKCYRNPREILVAAHSIGFGIYGDHVVQMLENEDHWKDLGYELTSGKLVKDDIVTISRPEKNSPSSISDSSRIDDLIGVQVLNSAADEVEFVAERVRRDVQVEGLSPEDIVILCADDRYARSYFGELSNKLQDHGINTNNLSIDSYAGDTFTRDKAVTLTSVHRAKGNEGYSVYVMGIDALFNRPSVRTRNLAFTAMTRAKAWLFVTGVGRGAEKFQDEVTQAKKHIPSMIFRYPSDDQLKVMKRDLEETTQQKLERALAEVMDDLSEEDIKNALAKLTAARKKKFS